MSNDPPKQPDAPEDEDLYCLDCGYNLRGLPGMSRTCPECGCHNELDPSNVDSVVVDRMARRLRQRAHGSVIALFFLAVSAPIAIAARSPLGLALAGIAGGIWLSLTFPTADGRESHRDVVRCGVVVIGYQFAVYALCGILFAMAFLGINKEGLLGFLPLVARALVASAALAPALAIVLVYILSPLADAMTRHFQGPARRMAERWHEERLRTPPQRRRPR